MSIPKHIALYTVLLGAAIMYKVLEHFQPATPWFHAYFEDLIAIPIIFKTSLLIVQKSVPSWRTRILSNLEVVVLTLIFAVYFELLLPNWNEKFTADPWDVLCYAIGAFVFSKWLNTPLIARIP